jgi:predicted Holliday junction resolvase-like endonuclease
MEIQKGKQSLYYNSSLHHNYQRGSLNPFHCSNFQESNLSRTLNQKFESKGCKWKLDKEIELKTWSQRDSNIQEGKEIQMD